MLDYRPAEVAVIGPTYNDYYCRANAARLDETASIPIYSFKDVANIPGAAANVARAFHALGCSTTFFTAKDSLCSFPDSMVVLGPDMHGHNACKVRIYDDHNRMVFRIDYDVDYAGIGEKCLSIATEHGIGDRLVLVDYGRGFFDFDDYCAFGKYVVSKELYILGHGSNWDKYPLNTRFLQLSMRAFTNLPGKTVIDMLRRRYRDAILLLSDGARGFHLSFPTNEVLHYPPHEGCVQLADAIGAGDSLFAGYIAGLFSNASLPFAADMANAAASVAIRHAGTYASPLCYVFRALGRKNPEYKICTLDTAKLVIESARSDNLVIGVANGVFDLCTIGHVSFLEDASKRCDFLVVLMNSDVSTRLNKPLGARPIVPENLRALSLAYLDFVDAIVIFDGITPSDEIQALRPDYLFKGQEYENDGSSAIPGHEYAKRGVVFLPQRFDIHTSSIVSQVVEASCSRKL